MNQQIIMGMSEMKKIIIKITDTMYEKIVNYEVDAPTQMIESIRHGIVLPNCGADMREVVEDDD